MNAKHLTLICSALALGLGKLVLVPGIAEYKRLSSELNASERGVSQVREIAQLVNKFPVKPLSLNSQSVALSTTVSSWVGSQKHYGIQINQITAQTAPSGQTKVPLVALAETDALTKLPTQKILVKGQYHSLNEFRQYLANEFSAEQAVVVEGLDMKGETFEISATIFSKAEQQ